MFCFIKTNIYSDAQLKGVAQIDDTHTGEGRETDWETGTADIWIIPKKLKVECFTKTNTHSHVELKCVLDKKRYTEAGKEAGKLAHTQANTVFVSGAS